MAWMRRTRHVGLAGFRDEPGAGVAARSFLTGRLEELSTGELAEPLELSARKCTWRVDDAATSLAACGFLVSDEAAEPFVALRRRDAELTALGWHPAAAAFHFATTWDGHRGVGPGRDGSPPSRGTRIGSPQTPFHDRGGDRLALAPVEREDELHRLLRSRRTARTFEPSRPVSAEELATLLHSVWGVHGTAKLALGDTGLRKTSPSGGALTRSRPTRSCAGSSRSPPASITIASPITSSSVSRRWTRRLARACSSACAPDSGGSQTRTSGL